MIPEFAAQGEGRREDRSAADELVRRGQGAARNGDLVRANRLLRAALIADPSHAEARLWLAAMAEDPEESLRLLSEVLRDHPEHARARAGLRWACGRLEARNAAARRPSPPARAELLPLPEAPRPSAGLGRVLVAAVCVLALLGAAFVVASYGWIELDRVLAMPFPTATAAWGDPVTVDLPPLYTPLPPTVAAPAAEATVPLPAPPATPTPTATTTPTAEPSPTVTPGSTPAPTVSSTAGVEPGAPGEVTPTPTPAYEGKWIEVVLDEQVLIAWEGGTEERRMVVSTGTDSYPTITGSYRIYLKLRSQTMRGADYHLPEVPHVMYFQGSFAIHGTYWHTNFGQPMSHGCINVSKEDAAWLFEWTEPTVTDDRFAAWATTEKPGTPVVVR